MQTMAIEMSEKDIAGPSAMKELPKNIVSEEKKDKPVVDTNKANKLFGKTN
jgi:hypothetical protein